MTDRELLEFAAKAVGLRFETNEKTVAVESPFIPDVYYRDWNPLHDDGDALRLAVQVGIAICPSNVSVIAWRLDAVDRDEALELLGNYPAKATRRAIVRAAAEIGKAMP